MRIYIACLACYNDGRLHGVFVEDSDLLDADSIDDKRKDMQAQCGHTDNDWAIHDSEGLGNIGEFTTFADVATRAELIDKHGEPFLAWASSQGLDDFRDNVGEQFEDAYHGEWSSLEAYAEDYVEQTGMLSGVPDLVARYFDYESFARDLQLGGDVFTLDAPNGVYVFNNY